MLQLIPTVEARDMPEDVDDWCCENDIYTHCERGLYQVYDDGNPLIEWVKYLGHEFKPGEPFYWIGVIGT